METELISDRTKEALNAALDDILAGDGDVKATFYEAINYLSESFFANEKVSAENHGRKPMMFLHFFTEGTPDKFKKDNPQVVANNQTIESGPFPDVPKVPYPKVGGTGSDKDYLAQDWIMLNMQPGSTKVCYYIGGQRKCFTR